MSRHQCPNCLEESAAEIDRSVTDAGLRRRFECRDCGHEWDVIF
ncbi:MULTISPECIES: transposase [Natrinema]|uniref:Transposase n=1 Tax=Natrinema salsiterrestre TaxID=2950540 RepID=A0A9Q4KY55_9EURY|nr:MULTISPECIES: transposase [Natrinema]MDF9745943.1 transposase [Natrinema salsiterrestre]